MAIINGTTFNLSGNSLNNRLTGDSAKNILSAGGGDDTLNGGLGEDKLIGGTGDDVYILADAFPNSKNYIIYDEVVENAGEGIDRVEISSDAVGARSYILGNKMAIINGTAFNDNNTFNGGTFCPSLIGTAAGDVINGLAGDDILEGKAGNDFLYGGLGDDIYFLSDVFTSGSGPTQTRSYDTVIENAGEGIDSVMIIDSDANPLLSSYTLGENIENATVTHVNPTIANINDGSDTLLTGNLAKNILTAGGGDDTLNGGLGEDKLIGGTGDDVYILADTFPNSKNYIIYDEVVENAGEGIDRVEVSSDAVGARSYILGNNIEWGVITGTTSFFTLVGNALGNTLYGSDQTDDILNGAGNARGNDSDMLFGYGGNDTLYASSNGRDVMYGGAGSDKFFFGKIDPLSFGADESDAIMDFDINSSSALHDFIILTDIDAKASVTGNNSFTFIGSAPFTAEGQLSATQIGADTVLSLNTSGKAGAEMQIWLIGANAGFLTADHFAL